MRRQFLSVYVGVALALLVAQALGFVALRREMVSEMDARAVQTLTPAVRMMQRRFHHERAHPGRERFLRDVAEHQGLRPRILEFEAAGLSEHDQRALRADELILTQVEGERSVVARLGPGEVLALGPVPPADPGPWMRRTLIQMSVFLALVGFVLVSLLRPYERRLAQLAEATEALGDGEFGTRVHDERTDAIGRVSRSFDHTAERLGDLVSGQRELLRAVSHELRTPLARLLFLSEDLREPTGDAERARKLDRFDASLGDMRGLVDELLEFARLASSDGLGERSEIAIAALVAGVAEDAGELRAGVRIDADVAANTTFVGAPRYVRRALLNVVANAVRHAATAVRITLEQGDEQVQLHVDDDGPGVPEGDRERVFEPFTRLDGSRRRHAEPGSEAGRQGAGLGLALVSRIMTAHGGDAKVVEGALGGARFTLSFPSHHAPS